MSLLRTPCAIATVITGIVIRIATKTGTVEDPNQSNAIRIKDTTGVALIIVIHGRNAAETAGYIPDVMPSAKDKNKDSKKAMIPRSQVASNIPAYEGVATRLIESINTDPGVGKINGSATTIDVICQMPTSAMVETNPVKKPLYFI